MFANQAGAKGGGGRGGHVPPQILADQKAPHYYLPPQIFRLWHTCLQMYLIFNMTFSTKVKVYLHSTNYYIIY